MSTKRKFFAFQQKEGGSKSECCFYKAGCIYFTGDECNTFKLVNISYGLLSDNISTIKEYCGGDISNIDIFLAEPSGNISFDPETNMFRAEHITIIDIVTDLTKYMKPEIKESEDIMDSPDIKKGIKYERQRRAQKGLETIFDALVESFDVE